MDESNGGERNTSDAFRYANLHGNVNQKLLKQWLTMSMQSVASTNATAAVWLQLTTVGIALHTSQLKSNSAVRASTHNAVIKNITSCERKCFDTLRLSPIAFDTLVSELKSKTKVNDYTRTSIEEQLITFLLVLGHNLKNRLVRVFLHRSGETISRYFHNILLAVITLEEFYIKAADETEIQPTILNSQRFFPYFKDCLGAIDGTHVRVKVSQVDAPRYRGRKEWPTQNVLAACTLDLKFTYILAGWEGSASDSRILQNALTRDEPLIIPEGKYYLGDSGFGLSNKVLTPYGRTRYHMKEYSQCDPKTPEELFNHRHSSIRNAIERAFGVLKKRFPIIASGSESQYTCGTMTKIILACCVLHNFMLTIDTEEVDQISEDIHLDDVETDAAQTEIHVINQNRSMEHRHGEELRARIATEMWADYNACSN